MQPADWRRPAQNAPYTRAFSLPHSMLHPAVPGADVPIVSSQPAAIISSQAVPTGYFGPPPPPPARHPFADYRQAQSLRPATQPWALDRVSTRRHTSDAAAKPFARPAYGLPSSAAPAVARQAKDMLSASSGQSLPHGKHKLIACEYTVVCFTRSMYLASMLMCYATKRYALL